MGTSRKDEKHTLPLTERAGWFDLHSTFEDAMKAAALAVQDEGLCDLVEPDDTDEGNE